MVWQHSYKSKRKKVCKIAWVHVIHILNLHLFGTINDCKVVTWVTDHLHVKKKPTFAMYTLAE